MYRIYRTNNYFVMVDPIGNYFEEQCENVFVTKKRENDTSYTISFLRQETISSSNVSQSFPGINFSDITDEAGVAYPSVADWEDFYTKNTGVGSSLPSLGTTSIVTTVGESATVKNFQAPNALRKSVKITNDGANTLYVREESGATTALYTWKLGPGEMAIIDDYTGIITGIWNAATGGSAVITETT